MGLAGDNSWGARPHDRYLIKPNREYSYTYLMNVSNENEPGKQQRKSSQQSSNSDDTQSQKPAGGNTGGWKQLFNGTDLSNFTRRNGSGKFEAVDGTIKGTTNEGSPNSFLCTNKNYQNFELTFEVKVDNRLNSGVQLRSRQKESDNSEGRVFGPQVEIEASGANGAEAGYIFGEATGRGWLTPKSDLKPHKHFNDDQWNNYRVLVEGPRFQTWINGQQISDLTDEKIFETHPTGFIGFQVHAIAKGQGPYSVQWRNIRIREIK